MNAEVRKYIYLLQKYILSDYFRISLQLAVGHLIISLFVFIHDLSFSKACLTAILFYAGIILRPDLHMSSYLNAGTLTAGCALAGSTASGIALSLGIVPDVSDWGRVGFLCLFGTLGMAVLATVRTVGPPGVGILASVMYLIAITSGQFVRPARAAWGHIVVPFYYVGSVACLAHLVSGCLVLPSLARQDLRATAAQLIQGLGHSLSAYASHILMDNPEDGKQHGKLIASPRTSPAEYYGLQNSASIHGITLPQSAPSKRPCNEQGPHVCDNMCAQLQKDQDPYATDEEYMAYLDEATDPENVESQSCPISPCLRQLRPAILHAQHLLNEARLEPPWADNCAMRIEKWGVLVTALNRLAVRNAALEGLLEGPEQIMNAAELHELLGCDVVPLFKVVFAQMAASCAAITEALHQSDQGQRAQAHMRLLLNPSYPVLEYELAAALHCVINAFWQRMQSDPNYRPTLQVRVLLYLGALCSGILEALTEVERKAVAVLACPGKDRGRVTKALHAMLSRTSLSSGEGAEPGEVDWKQNLYSGTQHRPLQQRPSTYLAAQSMRGPADSHAAAQPQPPHVQEDAPAMQRTNTPISSEHPKAPAARQLLSRPEKLPQAGQEDGQHDHQLPQPEKLGEGDSKKGQEGEGDGGAPAASQQDEDLVRVAHLGEGALLNDCPLLVRVMHSLRAPRIGSVRSSRSSHGQQHTQRPGEGPQGSAHQEESMRAGPSRGGRGNDAAGAIFIMLSGEQSKCHVAVLPDSGVGLVPSAAFLQNWDRHCTLHLQRLQAPRDGSSDDSAESSDESTSGSDGSCDEADGSQDAAAHVEAAQVDHCSTRKSIEMTPRKGGAANRGADGSSKGDRLRRLARRLKDEWGWLWPLLLQFCGYPVGEALVKAYGWAVPRYLGSSKSLQLILDVRRHRRLQFFLKYFIATSGVLCGVFALSQLSTGFRKYWIPYYSLLTVAVVLSEKVDSTVTKGFLRIVGSAIGGTFGYLVMLRSGLATDACALVAIGCGATLLIAPTTLTKYKYAVFLALVAFHSLILCQYRPVPGHHGSVQQFYARIVNIVVGVLIVLAIDLTCPWYTSVAALETLGKAYREATQLMEDYYVAFHQETQLAAEGRSPCPELQGVAVLERNTLIDRVAQPLSEVQVSVQKESVLWKKGLLIIPDIVHQLLYSMQVLQDRLEAVELMLMQRPIVSGRFTGHAYRHFVQPLDAAFREVCSRVKKVGELVQAVLSESTHPGHLDELQEAVEQLKRARMRLRRQNIETQQQLVADSDGDWTPDDALRFQSFLFAFFRGLDKCVLVARMVRQDEWIAAHVRAGRWRHTQVWLGKTLSWREERMLRRRARREEKDLEMARGTPDGSAQNN
ncbi:hypothetical protein COCOBI_14-2480 [Coccomyxa sp. Obi]|nr:hypothetical protein COCOBI_14-2480 [Coccomyxa sp. Obi]